MRNAREEAIFAALSKKCAKQQVIALAAKTVRPQPVSTPVVDDGPFKPNLDAFKPNLDLLTNRTL